MNIAAPIALNIVVFDTETNGLNVNLHDILSIGWLKCVYESTTHETLIEKHVERYVKNDNIYNTKESYNINKISDEYRSKHGVELADILTEFKTDIANCHVYAFNVNFDVSFIQKYDEHAFDNVADINEISLNERESVINSIQRIIYYMRHKFDIKLNIKMHLHTAYDDVFAELVIILHDHFRENVSMYFVRCKEYVPVIGSGLYKNVVVTNIQDKTWLSWFVHDKVSKHENYMREWILSHKLL